MLTFAGCNPRLSFFEAPDVVQTGRNFVVWVAGTSQDAVQSTGTVGCVIQLPPGFTVVSHSRGTPNDPQLLGLYTPEPGHTLFALHRQTSAAFYDSAHFVVSASATSGNHVLKVALADRVTATTFRAVDPPQTSFALVNGTGYVQSVLVQPATTDTFTLEPPFGFGGDTRNVILADVDSDGRADLVFGDGPRVFLARSSTWLDASPPSSGSANSSVAAGDFDGDGHLDLVHGSYGVYFGNGLGNWSRSVLAIGAGASALAAVDFDRDGRCDIVEADVRGDLWCLRGREDRTFAPANSGLTRAQFRHTQLALADLDGDGSIDIAASHGIWTGDGSGNWTAAATFAGIRGRFAVGDVLGDARPEVVFAAGGTSQAPTIMVHAGGIAWTQTDVAVTAGMHTDVQLLDLDFDGDLDLLLANSGVEGWLNQGSGTFVPAAATGLPPRLGMTGRHDAAVASVVIGDLDGDAVRDVVVCPSMSGEWEPLLFRNRGGAGAIPFGESCRMPQYVSPRLTASGRPTTGNAAFAFAVLDGSPSGVGIVWFGWSRRDFGGQPVLPMSLRSFGSPTCWLLVDPLTWSVCQLDAAGSGSVPFPIPPDPRLQGVRAFAQGAVFAPSANALGLLTANALLLIVE